MVSAPGRGPLERGKIIFFSKTSQFFFPELTQSPTQKVPGEVGFIEGKEAGHKHEHSPSNEARVGG